MKAKVNNRILVDKLGERLAALLENYELWDFETRERMRGGDSLYIRMRRIVPPTRISVVRG